MRLPSESGLLLYGSSGPTSVPSSTTIRVVACIAQSYFIMIQTVVKVLLFWISLPCITLLRLQILQNEKTDPALSCRNSVKCMVISVMEVYALQQQQLS